MIIKRKPVTVNILWNWVRYGINILVGLYITPFILGRLGEVGYGMWILLSALLGYSTLLNFGIESSVVRHLSKSIAENDTKSAEKLLQTSGLLFNFLGTFVFLLALSLSLAFTYSTGLSGSIFNISEELRGEFSLLFLILGFGLAASFFSRTHVGILKAAERYDIVNKIEIGLSITRALIVVLFMSNSLLLLGIIYSIFSLLLSITYITAAHIVLPGKQFYRKKFDREGFKKIRRYSIFTFLTYLADQLIFHTDPLIIGVFLPIGAIAYFDFANKLVGYFRNIVGQFATPFFPVFSRDEGIGDVSSIRHTFWRATKMAAYLSGLIAGVMLGSGKPFLQFWIGNTIGAENVSVSYEILLILLLPFLLSLAQAVSISVLYGLSKHHFLTLTTFAEGVGNLIISIILVKHFGLIGVAFGTAIPMLFTKVLFQPRYVCRLTGISAWKFILNILGGTLLICLASGGLQLAAYQFVSKSTTFINIFLIASTSTFFIGFSGFLVYFSVEDRQKIKRIFLEKILKQNGA